MSKKQLQICIAAYLLAMIIPITFLNVMIHQEQVAYNKYFSETLVADQMDRKQGQFMEWINQKKKYVEQTSLALENYVRFYGYNDTLIPLLTSISKSDPSLLQVYLTSESGRNFISEYKTPRVDGRTRPWYIQAIQQDPSSATISEIYQDVITKDRVITFSIPIVNAAKEATGVIGYDITLNEVIQTLEEDSLTAIVIIDEYGNELYHSSLADQLNYSIHYEDKGNYTIQHDQETLWHQSAYVLTDLGATLFFVQPIAQIDRTYKASSQVDQVAHFALIALLTILLVKVLTDHLGRHMAVITKSVNQLTPPDLSVIAIQFPGVDQVRKLLSDLRGEMALEMNEWKALVQHQKRIGEEADLIQSAIDDKNEEKQILKEELDKLQIISRTLVESLPDYIIVFDLHGRILNMNQKLKQALWSSEEVNPQEYTVSRVFKEAQGEALEDFMTVLTSREYNDLELNLQLDQLALTEVKVKTHRLMTDERMIGIQAICKDMSQNRQIHQEIYQRNKEIEIVNDVSKLLAASDDLDKTLQRIVDKVSLFLHASLCTIRLLTPDQKLVLHAFAGSTERMIIQDTPSSEGSHMGWSIAHNEVLRLYSQSDMKFHDPALADAMEELHVVVYVPLVAQGQSYGVLAVTSDHDISDEEIEILQSLADQAAIAIDRKRVFDELRSHYFKTIEALATAVEAKVPNMSGHTKRVSELATMVGKKLYLRRDQLSEVHIAGLLHDIGKIGIEDHVLLSGDTEDSDTIAIIDAHPAQSKSILSSIGISDTILQGIYYHHKRYDLKGFPYEDTSITSQPLLARIIQVVDNLDSILLHDQDQVRMETLEMAYQRLQKESGTAYCPEIIKVVGELIAESPLDILQLYAVESIKEGMRHEIS